MSTVVVTTEDGTYAGRFSWDKAGRWTDLDPVTRDGSGGPGRGEAVMLTAGGKWVLEHWTHWQGGHNRYEWITAEAAHAWLLRNREDDAVAEYFGSEPEEEDKRAGRPEIGGRITIALGADLLPRTDAYAAKHGIGRAEAIRQLVEIGLVGA